MIEVGNNEGEELLRPFCFHPEVPLKTYSRVHRGGAPLAVKMNGHTGEPEDTNSYDSLCEARIEACEFCDSVSMNRYTSIIHNARHIIIPLLKQNIYQCSECLHHFTSQYELNRHITVKHIIKQFEPQTVLVPDEPNVIEIISDSDDDRDDRVEDGIGIEIKQDKDIVDVEAINKVSNVSYKLIRLVKEIKKEKGTDMESEDVNCQDSKNRNAIAIEEVIKTEPVIDIDSIITKCLDSVGEKGSDLENNNDKYAQNNVEDGTDMESKDLNGGDMESREVVRHIKQRLVFEDDDQMYLDGVTQSNLKTVGNLNVEVSPVKPASETDHEEYKSVHYNDLMLPGLYKCKKCKKAFPTRYQSIVHEGRHISLDKTQIQFCQLCHKYVQGRLRHHIVQKHPFNAENILTECKKCGMKYLNYEKHDRAECIGTDEVYKERSTILQLCDICFSFRKNSQMKVYSVVGVLSRVGSKANCDGCGAQFLHINLVERIIRFKEKQGTHYSNKKKKLTNEDRLRMIKKRLKSMKKYFDVCFNL